MANPQVVFRKQNQDELPDVIERDEDTIYFTKDDGNLYLGSTTILEKVNELQAEDLDDPVVEADRMLQVPTAWAVLMYIASNTVHGNFVFRGQKDISGLSVADFGGEKAGYVYLVAGSGLIDNYKIEAGSLLLFIDDVHEGDPVLSSNFKLLQEPNMVQSVSLTNPTELRATSEKAVSDIVNAVLDWEEF